MLSPQQCKTSQDGCIANDAYTPDESRFALVEQNARRTSDSESLNCMRYRLLHQDVRCEQNPIIPATTASLDPGRLHVSGGSESVVEAGLNVCRVYLHCGGNDLLQITALRMG